MPADDRRSKGDINGQTHNDQGGCFCGRRGADGILGLDKIGFDQYLASDQFQQLMKDSMGSLIDTAALQEQFTAALQQVMGSVMANFSEQIAAELQAQLGTAMEQAMGQISTNLQSQMTERFSSLGSQMESALKIDAMPSGST